MLALETENFYETKEKYEVMRMNAISGNGFLPLKIRENG